MNTNQEIFNKRHLLGIDYGRKFTGIATYKVGNDPYPLSYGRIAYKSDEQLIKEVLHLAEEEFIDGIIVGVPYFTDGKESKMTKTINAFITSLEKSTEIQILTVDETLTTFEAEERMKQDPRYNFKVDLRKIDELCAAIIIEEFLKLSSI
jgi:putative Holliday junction resolvase